MNPIDVDLLLVLRRAIDAMKRVQALHEKIENETTDKPYCGYCNDDYPCRTIKELLGDVYPGTSPSEKSVSNLIDESNKILTKPVKFKKKISDVHISDNTDKGRHRNKNHNMYQDTLPLWPNYIDGDDYK